MRHASPSLEKLCWLALFLCLAMPCVAAEEIVLRLKNGDRISGVLVSETPERVVLTNRWNKELLVPLAEIEKREKPAPITNAVTNAKPEPVALPPTPPVPAAAKPSGVVWHGDFQVGLDLQRSTRDLDSFYTRAKVTMTRDRLRNIFEYNYLYSRSDLQLTAKRQEASIKTDFNLNKRMFVYNLLTGVKDEVRKIDLGYQIGPGIGYHAIVKTNFVLDLESGANYRVEDRANGARAEDFSLRLAENYTWKINKKLFHDQKLEFYPRFDRPEDYRVRAEATFRYLLLENLTLNFSVLDIYDTRPAAGVQKNDLQLRSSIGVRF